MIDGVARIGQGAAKLVSQHDFVFRDQYPHPSERFPLNSELYLNASFTGRSAPPRYAAAMLTGKTLFAIGVVIVGALAYAIHVYGPNLGRLIHGG